MMHIFLQKALFTYYQLQIGGMLQTQRTDKTFEIFGHNGITNYMNINLKMKCKSVNIASIVRIDMC